MAKFKADYTKILPVLFLEYLSVSIVRSLMPSMIVDAFGGYSYLAVGIMETLKGLLAFMSSPLFGKLSDKIGKHVMQSNYSTQLATALLYKLTITTFHNSGRKYCLLVTVVGTTLPVFVLAFSDNMILYSAALSVSGFFSATFALTFAYISDCVDSKHRAPAYGLALATFGLSFTVGPIAGSYIAAQFGSQIVFILALVLVVFNVFYIIFYLPETAKSVDVSILRVSVYCESVLSSIASISLLFTFTYPTLLFTYICLFAVGGEGVREAGRGYGVPAQQLEVRRNFRDIQVTLPNPQ